MMHNQFGCRNSVPNRGLPNIICVGDSITYGMPHGHIHAFPQVAEKLSEGRLGVLNMGCPGFAPSKILKHWEKHQAQHCPSLFVVQLPYYDRHHDPRHPYLEGVNDDTWLNGVMARKKEFTSAELSSMAKDLLPRSVDDCFSLLSCLHQSACVAVILYRYWSNVCPEFDENSDQ